MLDEILEALAALRAAPPTFDRDRDATCDWNCTKPYPHEGPCGAAPPAASPGVPPQDYKALYYELLYAVGMKHQGESRHETALRYIKRAEQPNGEAKSTAVPQASGREQEKP